MTGLKQLKELASDSLIYGISSVAARFINYLLVPFYTAYFNPDEYGIISLVFGTMIFLNVVFTFGMESAYLRYAADRDKAGSVFRTVQITVLLTGIMLGVIMILVKPLLSPLLSLQGSMGHIYWMMLGIVILDALGAAPFAELRLVRRSWLFASIRLINVLVNVALNLYLVIGRKWGIEAVFFSNLIASALATVWVTLATLKLWKGVFSKEILWTALSFGLPYVPTGIGYAINEVLDRFFLKQMPASTVEHLYGPGMTADAVIGIYSACYKLAVFMLLFIQMFRMAWQPFFLRHVDDPKAKELFSSVFLYFNIIAGFMFLFVGLFAHEIVQIKVPLLHASIINKRFWPGLFVVPWLMMAYWFQGWYVNFTAGIFIREKTRVLPFVTLCGAIVTIISNLILVPRIGMLGAALATLASYISMAILIYYYSQKYYPVPYKMMRSLIIVAFTIVLVVLGNEKILPHVGIITTRFILMFLGTGGLLFLLFYSQRRVATKGFFRIFKK